jgi:hypothetical protein
MKHKSSIIYLVIISSLVLMNCTGKKQSRLEKIQVELKSEGPLYSGPNTATGIWKPAISPGENVKSVRFSRVKISSPDTSLSGLAANIVFQLASNEAEMKKIAFYKGQALSNSLECQVAEEQKDLEAFFKGQEITFVLDYDLIPDEWNENLSFTLEFDAELITD